MRQAGLCPAWVLCTAGRLHKSWSQVPALEPRMGYILQLLLFPTKGWGRQQARERVDAEGQIYVCGFRAWGHRAAQEDAGGWATQLERGSLQLQMAVGIGQGAGNLELRKQKLQTEGQAILQQRGRAVCDHPGSYAPRVADSRSLSKCAQHRSFKCCSHLPDDHCGITVPQLTATGIWQKEGQKATDSKDPETSAAPEASLVTISPQHHPFNSRTFKHQLSFIYHKSASMRQPQCSLPLRAGLSPSKGSYRFA